MPNDIAIITPHFNFTGQGLPRASFRTFRESLTYPVITVELSLCNKFYCATEEHDIRLNGDDRSVMPQYSRLINLAIRRLPDHITKVAWIDNDILFDDHQWLDKLSELLDTVQLAQPFSNVVSVDKAGHRSKAMPSWASLERNRLVGATWQGRRGHAWGARIDALPKLPGDKEHVGLLERQLASEDTVMACVWAGKGPGSDTLSVGTAMSNYCFMWQAASKKRKMGWLSGSITQLSHGYIGRNEREYRRFLRSIRYDPFTDLVIHPRSGIFRWASHRDDAVTYFSQWLVPPAAAPVDATITTTVTPAVAIPTVDPVVITPVRILDDNDRKMQRWFYPTRPDRIKLLWISGDMAQGGCTRYAKDALNIVKDLPVDTHVVWFSDHHYWQFIEDELKKVASVSRYEPESFQSLVNNADVITSMNFNSYCTDHDRVLDMTTGKVFCQVHGTCFYANGIVEQHRRTTRYYLACSKRASKLCNQEGDQVINLPCPIDFSRLDRMRPKAEAKQDFCDVSPETPIVTYAGRLASEKGLLHITKTMEQLPAHIKLLVVGDGYHADVLVPEMTRRLGDRLILKKWVDHPSQFFDCTDVFLLQSDWEGLPLVLVEALCYGVPVVSVDVGVAFDYDIKIPGQMPYNAVWRYEGPQTVLEALAFDNPIQQQAIREHVRHVHDQQTIRDIWWNFLKKLKAEFNGCR